MDTSDAPHVPQPPRWLSATERAAWMSLTGIITRLPGALDAQLERDAGVTYFEYMVLAMLSEHDQRTMRMSHLAALTNGSPSRLSHVAKRLERRGLLRREPCAESGRFTNAILTDAGYDMVVVVAPTHVAHVRTLVIDALTEEQHTQLVKIGDQIMRRVDPERTYTAPQ